MRKFSWVFIIALLISDCAFATALPDPNVNKAKDTILADALAKITDDQLKAQPDIAQYKIDIANLNTYAKSMLEKKQREYSGFNADKQLVIVDDNDFMSAFKLYLQKEIEIAFYEGLSGRLSGFTIDGKPSLDQTAMAKNTAFVDELKKAQEGRNKRIADYLNYVALSPSGYENFSNWRSKF